MSARAIPRLAIVAACVLAITSMVAAGQPDEAARGAGPEFNVTFSRTASTEPYTGRVYVVASTNSLQTPVKSFYWLSPEILFGQDVVDWCPGDVLRMDSSTCVGYPARPVDLPKGRYYVQAVLDLNGRSHDVIAAPGNAISEVVVWRHDPEQPQTVHLDVSSQAGRARFGGFAFHEVCAFDEPEPEPFPWALCAHVRRCLASADVLHGASAAVPDSLRSTWIRRDDRW